LGALCSSGALGYSLVSLVLNPALGLMVYLGGVYSEAVWLCVYVCDVTEENNTKDAQWLGSILQ